MFERKTSVRLTNILFTSQSLFSAAQAAIITLVSIMAVEISGSEATAGLPGTMLTVATAVAALPIGMLMGRYGRRLGLSLSYGTSALGALLGVVAVVQGQFWLLMVSSALVGAGRAGAQQSRFAAGDMFPEDERGRMIGRVVLAGTVGAILGPLLINPGQWMAEALGISPDTAPWIVATVLLSLAALLMVTLLYPEPLRIAEAIDANERNEKKKRGEVDAPVRSVWTLMRLPRVQLAILATLISQVVMVALMTITPLHMSQQGHGVGAVSLVISVHILGMYALSSVTGYLIDRYGRVPMMVAGAVVLMLSAVIAPLSTTMPVLLVSLFLLGLGWNFGYIAGSSMLADSLQGEEKSQMQGVNDMLVYGAAGLGSFSSGPIFSEGGYLAVAGVVFVMALLMLWIVRLLSPAETVAKRSA